MKSKKPWTKALNILLGILLGIGFIVIIAEITMIYMTDRFAGILIIGAILLIVLIGFIAHKSSKE